MLFRSLDHTYAANANAMENTQAAESRLRDADLAKEMVDFSKHAVIEQAAQSMLAQANQMPQPNKKAEPIAKR